MKLIEYVYFEKPGEKQKLLELVDKSLDTIDLAGRIMTTFSIELEEADKIAKKFFKNKS